MRDIRNANYFVLDLKDFKTLEIEIFGNRVEDTLSSVVNEDQ